MTIQDVQLSLKYQNAADSVQNLHNEESSSSETIRSYKRRFWMLFLFSLLSMLCGMTFTQYVSMANITMCFYGVTAEAVNWTSLLFMVVYLVLVFPVSWMMGKIGLRKTVVMGSVCNTADRFGFVMLAQFFGSLSNVFVLAIPPCLAAVWFPRKEVSRACAMGVFGNQLGIALGFITAPLLISGECSKTDLIADGKKMFATIFTSCNVIILLLVVFSFQNEPQQPPSIAQANKKNIQESYLQSALMIVRNVHFVLVFIMYGLVVGTNFAVTTLLNNMMLHYFPVADIVIGWMGFTLTVTGLLGSIVYGYILDYTQNSKTSICVCSLSFLAVVAFSCLLPMNKLWIQFLTLGVLGFFLTGFLPVGFEYGIEVTYPESEITSSSLLNASTMLFGIIIIEIASPVLLSQGPTYANIVFSAALLSSAVISCFITKNYKRSKKNNEVTCSSNL